MSDNSTRTMIDLYVQEASAPMFLSGFFRTPPRNIHTSEYVEIDVIREDPDIAIAITDLKTGARMSEATKSTNKAFLPPVFDEAAPLNAFQLIKRMPGEDPFQDPNFGANATKESFRNFRRLESRVRRAVEQMCSQVLQTGAITLIDNDGNAVYVLDFKPKSSHMTTASITWPVDGSAGVPLSDLEALAVLVRRDGMINPNKLIFGRVAWQAFFANPLVKSLIITNQSSPQLAQLAPVSRGEGATYQGFIWIGNYKFELWTYDGFYKHPQTGTLTPFVDDDNVIMLGDGTRLDLSFGAIPMIVRPESRVLPFLPSRISSGPMGLDLTTNAWVTPDGRNLMVSAGTRPLAIPTQIDGFARISRVHA